MWQGGGDALDEARKEADEAWKEYEKAYCISKAARSAGRGPSLDLALENLDLARKKYISAEIAEWQIREKSGEELHPLAEEMLQRHLSGNPRG